MYEDLSETDRATLKDVYRRLRETDLMGCMQFLVSAPHLREEILNLGAVCAEAVRHKRLPLTLLDEAEFEAWRNLLREKPTTVAQYERVVEQHPRLKSLWIDSVHACIVADHLFRDDFVDDPMSYRFIDRKDTFYDG